MLGPLSRRWRRWMEQTRFLYAILLLKTVVVVVLLILLWALKQEKVVVVYMRF